MGKLDTLARLAKARRTLEKIEAVLGGSGDTILIDVTDAIDQTIMDVCGVPSEGEVFCRDGWAHDLLDYFRDEPKDRADDGARILALMEKGIQEWKSQPRPPDLHLV
jgi:hypothetical protein